MVTKQRGRFPFFKKGNLVREFKDWGSFGVRFFDIYIIMGIPGVLGVFWGEVNLRTPLYFVCIYIY